MGDEEKENTELVDVSEVSEVLEKTEPAAPDPTTEESLIEERATVATLRERFAAFLIDSIVLFYAYCVIGIVARRAFYDSWDGPIPFYGWQGMATHGFFAFICFMYYFLFEGVFYTTTGKFFCWMYVRKKTGDLASMASIFFRNLVRAVDYALPLIPIFLMELTRKHQRLGDIIAGTTVIKKHGNKSEPYSVSMANITSCSGRIFSGIVDLIIVLAMIGGLLLVLSPDYPLFSKILLLIIPLFPFLYFVTTESLTHASPGKWIFGYIITTEDGSSVSFASAVVRTIMRLADYNPAGLLAVWLSPKKQRFGDLAADTIISRQPRKWQGGLALGLWAFFAAACVWFGTQNTKNFFSKDFKFNFVPTIEFMGTIATESQYKQLTVTHIRFAAGDPNTIRTPAIFRPGETIYIISDVYGFMKSGRMVWLQEDLDIRYPDSSIGLHQENIVDYQQVVPSRGSVELTNSIQLPEDMQSGSYIVTITVRDLYGNENALAKQNFIVKSDSSQAEPPAPTNQSPSLNTPSPEQTLPQTNPPAEAANGNVKPNL